MVILPWALPSTPFDEDRRPLAEQTQLAQQPLTGLGGGETIREVHQDTPFSLVALTAADLSGTSARVRAKKSDGSWGPWYAAENLDGVGDEFERAARHRAGLRRPHHHGADRGRPAPAARRHRRRRSRRRPNRPAPELGYIPANTNQPFGQNVNAVLISPPQAPMGDLPLPNAVTPPGQPPDIITRAQWGADESMKCPNTVYDDGVRAGIVHHTAGSNDYGPQDSAAIVRSIYAYHTRTLGWCDIAYNALGRQVRAGVRGPGGRHGPARRGRPHRRIQQEHLGGGDARQLRPRAADTDPVARRSGGCSVGGWASTTSTRGAQSF